jgi:hypothetical protein
MSANTNSKPRQPTTPPRPGEKPTAKELAAQLAHKRVILGSQLAPPKPSKK